MRYYLLLISLLLTLSAHKIYRDYNNQTLPQGYQYYKLPIHHTIATTEIPQHINFENKQLTSSLSRYDFCCRGCMSNPIREIMSNGRNINATDCDGNNDHSLPLKNGEEWVHEDLISILNTLYEETTIRPIVDIGHCCPKHLTYLYGDHTPTVRKHLMAAQAIFHMNTDININKIIEILNQKLYSKKPLKKDHEGDFSNQYIQIKTKEHPIRKDDHEYICLTIKKYQKTNKTVSFDWTSYKSIYR
ncbi:hypothetical protein N9N03_00150 [Chlamydiia bacterium]|nr:hypothetical protein [Chlamydiia bacterium]